MIRVIIDDSTWAELRRGNDLLELCDRSGRVLAYYQPAFRIGRVDFGKIRSPYSDEEVEALRHQTGGRSLAEFWNERIR